MEHFLQDLRYALRGLKNAPGYPATVVLTLAIFADAAMVMARIKPGVSPQQALAEARNLLAHSDDKDPIGVTLTAHRNPGDKDSDIPFTQPLTIVGVVENELQRHFPGIDILNPLRRAARR